MIHPSTKLELVDPMVGYGVFATEPIPRGTLVWVLDDLDQVVPDERRMELDGGLRALLDKYAYRDEEGLSVLCWDDARYVNHDCECNCIGPRGGYFEIAVRDIEAGEQLTDDYRYFGLDDDFPCRCGAPSCTGMVRMSDAPLHEARWRDLLMAASQRFHLVAQPLGPWLRDPEFFDAYRGDGEGGPREALRLGGGAAAPHRGTFAR